MKSIVIGMVGAGRATELHMNALHRVSQIDLRFKTIVARRCEQLVPAYEKYGFENYSYRFEDLLEDPEIDVIDICTPPYLHKDMVLKTLKAHKHVICEKPLTGYFGSDENSLSLGDSVSKKDMFLHLEESLQELEEAIQSSSSLFMYAENFVYSPSVVKAGQLIQAKKSRILYMIGEESLKGSSSPVAGLWSKTGGGTFIRTGTHPLSALLWLKRQESEARGLPIRVESVLADMGRITPTLSDYEHRHILANPQDVEDNGTVILTFTDQSKALILATDTCLGGSKNVIELYCNDAHLNCHLTPNNLMDSYFLDEDGLDNIALSEMLPSKLGWNQPFISDEIIRGYTDEMQDFMESIFYNRQPRSDYQLAADTIRITYAAYLSAEKNCRIYL